MTRHPAGRGLEIGNVLHHYGHAGHRVIDKYEVAPHVDNLDVVDLDGQFDWIVAVSTLEHVGWEEVPREPEKVERAVDRIRACLAPGGRAFLTCPVGQNPYLDELIRANRLQPEHEGFLERHAGGSHWHEVDEQAGRSARDAPPPGAYADLLWIAEFGPHG
jgi:SAM-dependent methyltransferase